MVLATNLTCYIHPKKLSKNYFDAIILFYTVCRIVAILTFQLSFLFCAL